MSDYIGGLVIYGTLFEVTLSSVPIIGWDGIKMTLNKTGLILDDKGRQRTSKWGEVYGRYCGSS